MLSTAIHHSYVKEIESLTMFLKYWQLYRHCAKTTFDLVEPKRNSRTGEIGRHHISDPNEKRSMLQRYRMCF